MKKGATPAKPAKAPKSDSKAAKPTPEKAGKTAKPEKATKPAPKAAKPAAPAKPAKSVAPAKPAKAETKPAPAAKPAAPAKVSPAGKAAAPAPATAAAKSGPPPKADLAPKGPTGLIAKAVAKASAESGDSDIVPSSYVRPAAPKPPPPPPKPIPGLKAGKNAEIAVFSTRTPRAQHFRMPAEWEQHFGTWMTWPGKKGISFPGKGALDAVQPIFMQMVRALLTSEQVFINIGDEDDKHAIKNELTIAEQRLVHFVDIDVQEPWCRDHGCTYLVRNEDLAGGAVIWKFNAWGNKYDKASADGKIGMSMAKHIGGTLYEPGVVMEGGSFEVNGTGTVLTTESCLLNKNRNRGFKKEDVEKVLKDYLGVSNVLWLPCGIEGDDTDGHIDDITRFVSRNTVLTCVEDNPMDKNHAILQRNYELLQEMKLEDGSQLQVVPLPMPQPIIREGQRLPASYANFYIANKIVLMPTFDDPADEKALEIMVRCFPSRRIFPIDCKDIIWGLGAFHCLTQQLPRVAYPKVIELLRNPPPAPKPVY